ncbi:MAG: NUDIX domain-containing protein [Clostridia bacterium]|jgi:8-oxo-dGTP pyrophosphatase MutT (NUDIX family)|nr:NUDIX domain-containing protein [Clostridia bacterium]
MFKENSIRKVALGFTLRNNKLLVEKGFDKVKKMPFYRCIGGGIEKNELPIEALKREFYEELNFNIIVNKELGIIDNTFVYNGKQGHEIIHLFDITIPDNNYSKKYTIVDNNNDTSYGEWIDISEFKEGKKILFPKDMLNYL